MIGALRVKDWFVLSVIFIDKYRSAGILCLNIINIFY